MLGVDEAGFGVEQEQRRFWFDKRASLYTGPSTMLSPDSKKVGGSNPPCDHRVFSCLFSS